LRRRLANFLRRFQHSSLNFIARFCHGSPCERWFASVIPRVAGTIAAVLRWLGMETKAYEPSHDHTGRLVAASLFALWTAVSVAAALAE
jgi:hypothetical protein